MRISIDSDAYTLLHMTIQEFNRLERIIALTFGGHQTTTPPLPARPTAANAECEQQRSFTEKVFPLSFLHKSLPRSFSFFGIRVRASLERRSRLDNVGCVFFNQELVDQYRQDAEKVVV